MQIGVVLVYFAVCILIGFIYRKIGLENESHFWVAGRQIGVFIGALAMGSAYMSANAFVGAAGMGYQSGLPFVFTVTGMCGLGFIVAQILVATPLARRAIDFTITDYLVERYQSTILKVAVPIIIVILMTLYIVPQLKASGLVMEPLFNMPYTWGVIITGIIFILYVSLGGMWAVTMTDAIQAAIMFVALVGLGCVTFLSNPKEILSLAFSNNPGLGSLGLPLLSYVGAGVLWFFGVAGLPHLIMRIYTAKGESIARKTLIAGVVYFNLFYLAGVVLVTIVASAMFPGLTDPDNATIYVMTLAPTFLQALVSAGLLAAVMTTTDALLITVSATISHDLYKKLINPKASQKTVINVGKISTWVIGAIGIWLALQDVGLINIMVAGAIGIASSSIAMPLILGINWSRPGRLAGEAGVIGGFLVSFILYVLKLVPPMSEAIFGVTTSAVLMVIITLLSSKPSQEISDSFIKSTSSTSEK